MTSFSVIGIYVDDIEKAKDIYCNTLGFEVENTYDDGCIIQLKSDGPTVILETVEKPANTVYPDGSQVVLCVATDNIEKTSKEFRDKGVNFLHDGPQPFAAGRFMAMKDPAGNILELLEFRRE